jgi:tRNA-2-methylthio-N6-dimethylallyladenosine synthase
VIITHAAPHHLTADAGLLALRRTRGGDAWQARQSTPEFARTAVNLGMPSVGVPAIVRRAQNCIAN